MLFVFKAGPRVSLRLSVTFVTVICIPFFSSLKAHKPMAIAPIRRDRHEFAGLGTFIRAEREMTMARAGAHHVISAISLVVSGRQGFDEARPSNAGLQTKEIPGTRVVSSHEKPVAHLPKFGYCSCPSP